MNKGISFVEHSEYSTPQMLEQDDKDFVFNGYQNGYFYDIIEIYNTSPTVNGIVDELTRLVYGKGLAVLDDEGEPIEFDNKKSKQSKVMDTINELISAEDLKRVIKDRIMLSNTAVKVEYEGEGNYRKVTKISHWPVISLAPKKMKGTDTMVKSYAWFPDWRKWKEGEKHKGFIPAFNADEDMKAPVEFAVNKPYCPGYNYWSPLEWSGGVDAAIVERDIWAYHMTQCARGFSPGIVVNVRRSTDSEEERQEIADDISSRFSGPGGDPTMVSINDVEGEEMTIDTVDKPSAPAHYEHIAKQAPRVIATAFRLNNPKLLGLQTDGEQGLGNNAGEIEVADDLLYLHVVQPIANELIENLLKPILMVNKIDENIGFIRIPALDFDKYQMAEDEEDIVDDAEGASADDNDKPFYG